MGDRGYTGEGTHLASSDDGLEHLGRGLPAVGQDTEALGGGRRLGHLGQVAQEGDEVLVGEAEGPEVGGRGP